MIPRSLQKNLTKKNNLKYFVLWTDAISTRQETIVRLININLTFGPTLFAVAGVSFSFARADRAKSVKGNCGAPQGQ